MRIRSLGVAAAVAMLIGSAVPAPAVDRPISGAQLLLKRHGNTQRLVFVSRDPAMPFPGIGGADDPSARGMVVQIFARGLAGENAILGAAPGIGNPGWRVRPRPPAAYLHRDVGAPGGGHELGNVILRDGRMLRVTAPSTGLSLAAPAGSVGIRIQMGDLRVCALFADGAVRRDVPGTFIGRNAAAGALTDCSDEQLRRLTCDETLGPACGGSCPAGSECAGDFASCFCVDANQPCGDTEPACNGECPAGEACGNVGGLPYLDCACLPAGSQPCGDSATPACDGDCPAGTSCFGVSFPIPGGGEISGCQCLTGPPVDPCGGCPAGYTCVGPRPGFSAMCVAFCNGPSGPPVCDGSCPGDDPCVSVGGVCLCVP